MPAQSVTVRIANCVPCDRDTEWDVRATQAVQQWLADSGVSNNDHIFVEARIEHTVLDTLWVDSLRVVERLPTLGTFVHLLSVRHQLVRQRYGVLDDRATVALRRMAAEADVDLGGGVQQADERDDETVCESDLDADVDEESADRGDVKVMMPSNDDEMNGQTVVEATSADLYEQSDNDDISQTTNNVPNLDEENWDNSNFPAYIPQVAAARTMETTADSDDESEKEYDVQFSNEDILKMVCK